MALYCTHYVEHGESSKYVGNKKRDGADSHCGDSEEECGQEIEGMHDPYCLEHMAMYPCSCGHIPMAHEHTEEAGYDGEYEDWQENNSCRECKCKGYDGEI